MFLLPITLLFFAVFDIKGFTRKSVFFCMMIGGLTELAQYFIPGRACSLLDFSVNILGVFTIPIIILLVIEKVKEDEQPNEYEL
jgi:VanZ family protein